MDGGRSHDDARMVVFASSPPEKYVQYAKIVCTIKEDIPEPSKSYRCRIFNRRAFWAPLDILAILSIKSMNKSCKRVNWKI
jgi:hypothetical protein